MEPSPLDRLTWKRLLQLLGVLTALGIGIQWLRGEPILGLQEGHEPLLYVLTIAGSLGLSLISSLFPVLDRPAFSRKARAISTEERTRNRAAMLTLVERIWIDGYLKQALQQMAALKLDLRFAEPDKVLRREGIADYRLADSAAIAQTFHDMGRRLVILGEPGAGKTVTLLQLARDLIAEVQTDSQRRIPVVLALSSWAARRLPLRP